jgi:hypothetical protein
VLHDGKLDGFTAAYVKMGTLLMQFNSVPFVFARYGTGRSPFAMLDSAGEGLGAEFATTAFCVLLALMDGIATRPGAGGVGSAAAVRPPAGSAPGSPDACSPTRVAAVLTNLQACLRQSRWCPLPEHRPVLDLSSAEPTLCPRVCNGDCVAAAGAGASAGASPSPKPLLASQAMAAARAGLDTVRSVCGQASAHRSEPSCVTFRGLAASPESGGLIIRPEQEAYMLAMLQALGEAMVKPLEQGMAAAVRAVDACEQVLNSEVRKRLVLVSSKAVGDLEKCSARLFAEVERCGSANFANRWHVPEAAAAHCSHTPAVAAGSQP